MSEMNPALQQALSQAENSAKQAPAGSLNAIGFVKEQQGTQGIGGKIVGEGVDIKISDFIDKGTLIKSIAPGGELNGLKGMQEISNQVKINADQSLADRKTNQGISSPSKGQ